MKWSMKNLCNLEGRRHSPSFPFMDWMEIKARATCHWTVAFFQDQGTLYLLPDITVFQVKVRLDFNRYHLESKRTVYNQNNFMNFCFLSKRLAVFAMCNSVHKKSVCPRIGLTRHREYRRFYVYKFPSNCVNFVYTQLKVHISVLFGWSGQKRKWILRLQVQGYTYHEFPGTKGWYLCPSMSVVCGKCQAPLGNEEQYQN